MADQEQQAPATPPGIAPLAALRTPRRKADISGIHPLTPQQQGLLVHAREAAGSGGDPYFSQDTLVLEGELDAPAFEAAWADVVARHAILRTDFRWEDVPQPLQIVFNRRPAPLLWLDWRDQPDADATLARHVDAVRAGGFDFARAADPQLALARVGPARWFLVWAYHHIAIDGWSYALVMRDLLACYEARRHGTVPQLPPARPFSDHLAWLARQDAAAAEAFWRDELAHIGTPTPLPLARPTSAPASRWGEFSVTLPTGPMLATFAQHEHITPGTLCQGLWALLLGRLAGVHQVTFGVTVSGRPADLPGAENIAGLFINTLPLSVSLEGRMPLGDWLRGIQSHTARLRQFEHFSLARIQALSAGAGRSLFESLLVIENFPVDAALTAHDMPAEPGRLRASLHLPVAQGQDLLVTGRGRNNYPLTLVFVPGGAAARLVFAYDRHRFDDAAMQALGTQARTLLDTLVEHARRPLDEIALATPAQAAALDLQGQGRWEGAGAPAFRSLPAQIAQWARSQPAAIAITAVDRSLSYAELDTRATRLAQALRGRGVGEGDRVALLSERSAAYIIALLGVMKAGAAYLPLDPAQPPQRLARLLRDARPALLLAQDPAQARSIAPWATIQDITADADANAMAKLPDTLQPAAPAYVIYTSGSTGAPKGVVLTHAGLAQYAAGLQQRLKAAPGLRHAMVSTVAADLGHTTLFGALASGGTLCLLPTALSFDPDGFAEWMRAQQVDVLKIVPSHLGGLLAAEAPALPRVALVLGGEAASPVLLKQVRDLAQPAMRLLNHYGPTETTVGVLTDEPPEGQWPPAGTILPLGRPLPGCRVVVLDTALQPVPEGAAGELYIGGISLAQGYLDRPDLTAERFVPDPHRPGQRLYRSGDRVAWRADGRLVFHGRADDQVKIRGHRVEPHELVAALRALPGVNDAAVAVRAGDTGALRLLAYVTPATLQAQTLQRLLADSLPEYLQPAAVVPLAAMPLTPNGKLDRHALPEPALDTLPAADDAATAPRSPVEQALAAIWAAVLQREQVGLHDNFFELGGDSILNLQVIARARRAGLRITPRQVFEQQTIAKLARVAAPLSDTPAPPAATTPSGSTDAPLTPIQHWFFASRQPEPNHWNQAVLLRADRSLDPTVLEASLRLLVARHDALRLRFHGARQSTRPAGDSVAAVESFDLSGCGETQARTEIERTGTALQRRLSLSEGPLLRAACFDLGPQRAGRLLLAAHHLAIDTVSWQILVGELQHVYERLQAGASPELPPVDTSYLDWAKRLPGETARRVAELPYWQQSAAGPARTVGMDMRYAAARHHRMQLSGDTTAALLARAPAALRCRSEELLLTALTQALCAMQRTDAIAIELEGHGRDLALAGEEPDLTGTVGWFTCRYPVRLVPGPGGPLEALDAVSAQLRQVPGKGVGYGLLKYLSEDTSIRQALNALAGPDVTFNYLGQLDAGRADNWLHPVDEPTGPTRGLRNLRTHALDIDAHVADGRLTVEWTWAPGPQFDAAAIEALAASFERHLLALLSLPGRQAPVLLPGDFPLARLSVSELQALQARWPGLSDIYPLAPLQAGILFHSLDAHHHEAMYLNQLHCHIRTPLRPDLLEQAWQEAVARHAMLRTVFAWEGVDEPHQLVLDRAELPLRRLNLQQPVELRAFLTADLARGFDLGRAPLMRVTLIELSGAWHLVWTRHHLLLDGWSSARLLTEVFQRYDTLARDVVPAPAASPPAYRHHIAWLQQRDTAADDTWWRTQLAGLTEPTLLQACAGRASGEAGMARLSPALPPGLGDALSALARREHVTVNTLVQAAWAYVLSRHAGRRELVFGITVSGRPADLPGADRMIGLFINTLPLRVQLPAERTLSAWWQSLQQQNAALREHEQAQLARLQGLADMAPGTPLFDSLLVFENYPVDREGLAGLQGTIDIAMVEADETLSLPMTLIVYPGSGMSVEFAYRRDAFEAAAVERLAGQFAKVLEDFTRMADQPLAALSLDAAVQIEPLPPAKLVPGTLVARFEAQVARTPDAIALCGAGAALSYAELNEQANRLAWSLAAQGVGPDVPVALCLERSNRLLVALLGVLKAGGCYVPLDPAAPADRLRHIVTDSGARCVLHDGEGTCWMDGLSLPTIGLDSLLGATEGLDGPIANPAPRTREDQLAYVIYTSGSTGRPKGVPVTHANVTRLFDSSHALFEFGPQDVWTLFHSCAFDFSVWEMWGAWLHGGRLVIVPQAVARDTPAFLDLVCREQVTVLNQTPSAFYPLAELATGGPSPAWALRCVIFGGEALDPARLSAWCARFGDESPQLVNMYGITETTVHVTYRRLRRDDLQLGSLIGQALPDLQLRVLDDAMQPLPVGVAGELFVGGAGLARGYLGQPGLTAERFVPDPWHPAGARLYRSGDLARRLPDGGFEYLGRADQQVKVRGFRIELGEVEAQLRHGPGVRDVAVLSRPDRHGATELVACVVHGPGGDRDSLRRHARAVLPGYMVPAAFVSLDALPITVNGKLDRKALSALAAATPPGEAASQAPRDELERQIAGLWCALLKLDQVDIHGDFFALGGHSLLATRAVARLRESTGLPIGIADLFAHPTVATLARRVAGLKNPQPESSGPAVPEAGFMSKLLDELEQEAS